MTTADLEIFKELTGREHPPKDVRECWIIAGRRSGKSFISALVAVFLACFRDFTPYLAPGERAHILVIAADRQQAGVVFGYIRGFLHGNPMLERLIESEKAESIDLTNRTTVQVRTCSYRSIRGVTCAAGVCDEISFWKDELSSNPGEETLRALRPSLATIPNSMLLCISTPYVQSGPVWNAFRKHYGEEDSDVLVIKAPTRSLNPTIDIGLINREMELDPESAKAEYLCEFRSGISTFFDPETLDSAVIHSRHELPPRQSVEGKQILYTAHFDASGGVVDAAALCLAHEEDDMAILDLVRRWAAPHDPSKVIAEVAEICRKYGVRRVTGDRFGAQFPVSEFRRHRIEFVPSSRNTSGNFLELLHLVNSGRCALLEHKVLLSELRHLERRVRIGAKDLITHPPRGHDDVAAAAAGALVEAVSQESQMRCWSIELRDLCNPKRNPEPYTGKFIEFWKETDE